MEKLASFDVGLIFCSCRMDKSEELKILTLHQERPVRLPGCPADEDLCEISIFENAFAQSIHKCDFQKMCSMDS